MLNRIDLIGRLVRDPEYKTMNDGTGFCNFTIAVDDDFKDKGGNKQTDFIDCTAWRKTAEYVTTYQTKGSLVAVSGRLKSRKWTDKDGNKRTSWFVNVDNVWGVGGRQDSQQGQSPGTYQGGYAAGNYAGNSYAAPAYTPRMDTAPEYGMLTDDDPSLPF